MKEVRRNEENCATLPMNGIAAALRAADALDSDISSELGQIVSLFDEAEKGLESKLYQVRALRRSIKEKLRQRRTLTAECGTQAIRLLS
jgi:hypothetical protein